MHRPIGVFDSGVGGLSVLRHIHALLPSEHLIYVADQANVPYGPKSAETIRILSHRIVQFLLDQDAKLIVVACNTATAGAIEYLRATFPDVPFVAMEPAVKPGAEATTSGKVGILATAGTFKSQRYESLMARYAQDVQLFENPCVGLVGIVEENDRESAEILLTTVLDPMLAAGVDTLVLGCTHYPFVQPIIRRIIGDHITIIDPAPAVARQTQRLLQQYELMATGSGQVTAYTTGDPAIFATQITNLLGNPLLDVRHVTIPLIAQ